MYCDATAPWVARQPLFLLSSNAGEKLLSEADLHLVYASQVELNGITKWCPVRLRAAELKSSRASRSDSSWRNQLLASKVWLKTSAERAATTPIDFSEVWPFLMSKYKWVRSYMEPMAVALLVWVSCSAACGCCALLCSSVTLSCVLSPLPPGSSVQPVLLAAFAGHSQTYQEKEQFMVDVALVVCLSSALRVYGAIKRHSHN